MLGKVKIAHDTERFSIATANRQGVQGFVPVIKSFQAIADAAYGRTDVARREAAEAVRATGDKDTCELAVLALAQIGDTVNAQKAAKLSRDFPKATPSRLSIFLWCGRWANCSGTVQRRLSMPWNLPESTNLEPAPELPISGRSTFADRHFFVLHDGAKAAAEFQKILDHHGAVALIEVYPVAHLGLARAYIQEGDTAKARAAYQNFFALWKDADPDIPVLQQAKAEYEAAIARSSENAFGTPLASC